MCYDLLKNTYSFCIIDITCWYTHCVYIIVHIWHKINSISSAVSFSTFCCTLITVTLHCITKCAAKLPVYKFEFPSVPWRQTTVFELTLISITKHGTTFAMLIGYRCSFDSRREDSHLFWTMMELVYHDKWQNSRVPYLQLSDACIYRYILNFVSLLGSSSVSEDWHLLTMSVTAWSIALGVQQLWAFERRCWLEYSVIRRGRDGKSEKTTEQKALWLYFARNTYFEVEPD